MMVNPVNNQFLCNLVWKFFINTDAYKFCIIHVCISLVNVYLCLKYYDHNGGKDNFNVMCYLLAGDTNSGNK
jgi:hypothetical protein